MGHVHRQGGEEYALVVQTEGAAYYSGALWPFYDSLHSSVKALKVSPVSVEKKEEGLAALVERSRKQMESAMKGVQFYNKAKAEVMAKYEAQLKQKDLRFNVKRVGISTGLFVPDGGAEQCATALEHADEAQGAAKALGKDQLRVYYSRFVRRVEFQIRSAVPEGKTN